MLSKPSGTGRETQGLEAASNSAGHLKLKSVAVDRLLRKSPDVILHLETLKIVFQAKLLVKTNTSASYSEFLDCVIYQRKQKNC